MSRSGSWWFTTAGFCDATLCVVLHQCLDHAILSCSRPLFAGASSPAQSGRGYGRHVSVRGGVGAPPPPSPAVLVPLSPPRFVATVGIAAFGRGHERAHASACVSAHLRVDAHGDGGGVGTPPPASPAALVPLSPPRFVATAGIAALGRVRERAHASTCASAHPRVNAGGDGGEPPPPAPASLLAVTTMIASLRPQRDHDRARRTNVARRLQ